MATFTKFRDPKTGRFIEFRKNKNLTKEIFQETDKGGTRIGSKTKKWNVKTTSDRIIVIGADGKRKSVANIRTKINYEKGTVFKDGVKVFSLSREGFLSKKQVSDIKDFLKAPKKEKKTVKGFIQIDLYPERYKKSGDDGNFSESNIDIEDDNENDEKNNE